MHGVLQDVATKCKDTNLRYGMTGEVKAILQRVQVIHHQTRGPATTWQSAEHAGQRRRRGHHAFFRDTFHGASRVVREDDRHGLYEAFQQHHDHVELAEGGVVVGKRSQKQNVLASDLVHLWCT